MDNNTEWRFNKIDDRLFEIIQLLKDKNPNKSLNVDSNTKLHCPWIACDNNENCKCTIGYVEFTSVRINDKDYLDCKDFTYI